MPRAALSVADVFRRYGDAFRSQVPAALSTAQRRVMTAIEQCRTAALGGHVEQCDRCGHRRVWYNSCRNRHCPTCQSLARAEWLERRRADLLPTEYFHVVFTVPPAVAEIAAQNKAVVYGLLFRTVAETLRTIAADPRHLGAEIGFFAVLHTWGQTLVHHPHLHCVIPGGGLANDGSGWVACRPGFFLPVRVLSRYFRRVLLAALEDAFESGQLRFAGRLQPLADARRFAEHLRPARQTEWVVYAKRPFAGPEQVLDYLGRYTHRIAISNQRLRSLDDGTERSGRAVGPREHGQHGPGPPARRGGNRLDTEVRYGLPIGARLVATPRVGLRTSEYGRGYRVGYGMQVTRAGRPEPGARDQGGATREPGVPPPAGQTRRRRPARHRSRQTRLVGEKAQQRQKKNPPSGPPQRVAVDR